MMMMMPLAERNVLMASNGYERGSGAAMCRKDWKRDAFPMDVNKYTPTMVTVMLCSLNPFIYRDRRLWDGRAKVA